jgi:hypothetical protein
MTNIDPKRGGEPLLTAGDLPVDLLAALDRAAAAEPGRATRADLVSRILSEWLRAKGYMRGAGCDEGVRPENLTSENDI